MPLILSQTTDFRLFKTERFCRRQFKFDENGRKFSKRIENNVGKGEIARSEQFLLFPQCFQKIPAADMLKQGLVWERVNSLPNNKFFEYPHIHSICRRQIKCC